MVTEKERSKILSSAEVAVLFQRGEIAVGVDQVHGSDYTSRARRLIQAVIQSVTQAVMQAVTQAVQRRPIIQAQPTRR